VPSLNDFLHGYFEEPKTLHAPVKPHHPGVGQVWVDTQFEKMKEKTKPGTATAINASSFHVMRKVGLPTAFNGEGLNNPHNMWTDKDQKVIYQTEWFDNRVTVFDRHSGKLLTSYDFGVNGPAPAHVMTRMTPDPLHKDDVHVSLNGGNDVAEFSPFAKGFNWSRYIPMGNTPDEPVHPHAHWMSADGGMMVTPNEDADNSSLYNFPNNTLQQTTTTGHMPIATGMTPDSSKYYVANFADSTISVITIVNGQPSAPTNINLLANYNNPDLLKPDASISGPVGGLPIQTPVSPDGKYVLTANTLTATITVIDTATDTVIGMLPCDPGCHGVQFGAKRGGGYYAYVSSKFSNRLLVVDMDHIKSGKFDKAIVGSILLAHEHGRGAAMDGTISDYAGMGGQGVLPIPVVYNGWVQQLPPHYLHQLTPKQRNPIGPYGDHSHDGPGHP
jgi:YVTN family beta-propeller protein